MVFAQTHNEWKILDDVTGSERSWHCDNKQHLNENEMGKHKPQMKTNSLCLL